uniref:Uncharacterized protein n=1 Tax=Micrurus corallinus TaxID=54390 RepID=A0A2D4H1G5_MICCO
MHPRSLPHLIAAIYQPCNFLQASPLSFTAGNRQEVATPNNHGVQLKMATGTEGIVVIKKCGCTLQPHYFTTTLLSNGNSCPNRCCTHIFKHSFKIKFIFL